MAQQLTLATASGEMHGLINTLTNSVPFDDFKNMKPDHQKELQKQKKEDSRLVKAEYMNSRGRHERLTKPYCRYAGDPIHVYHLIPGKVYDLPMGFINEVNDKAKIMKKRSGLVSVDGAPVSSNEAPLNNDEEGDWLHKIIPISFQ
ncbi:MAG TPA: hypothetical protein VFP87_01710 [Chitinophagaceae bacterium]|nr:hypothetical protein [Chitinophagaceae bacterium]